jgi:hypothetical protein
MVSFVHWIIWFRGVSEAPFDGSLATIIEFDEEEEEEAFCLAPDVYEHRRFRLSTTSDR